MPALDLALPMLRCPICGAGLQRVAAGLRCPAGHNFDIARGGYVSLLTGTKPISGDTAAMVQARDRFLAAGSYAPIRTAIVALAERTTRPSATVLDVGCGTGYYLAGVLDALSAECGLGLDSSTRALRVAARAHPRAAAATWDVFRPFPVAAESVGLVLDTFAPRNPSEFHRVLRPGGHLIVTRPTAGHLSRLRQVEGTIGIDPTKEERLREALDPYFEAVDSERIEYVAPLTRQEATDLVLMSPSARHLDAEKLDQEDALPAEADVSVLVTAFRRR